jgi:hypothetical protein
MRVADFVALPESVRHAILHVFVNTEAESVGVAPGQLLEHSEQCDNCRKRMLHRFEVFLTANVDTLLVELMSSQANPWIN